MNYKKSLQHQDRNIMLPDALIDTDLQPRREASTLEMVCLTAALFFACTTAVLLVKGCDREPMPAVIKSQCVSCHSKEGIMAYYFRKKGVKSPEQMAEAVLRTRNPRLLAAMNVGGEKKTPHTAMKTGWKRQFSGAWQTHDRWGKITKHSTITEQALIAEFALETHVAEQKNVIKGLNAYGGESDLKNGKYAFNVLKELAEVPK